MGRPPGVLSSARFEAGGEPLPLPRRIGVTAWRWLGFGTLAIILWAVRSLMVGAALGLPGDGPGAGRATILALLAVRRFRRLFVFLGVAFLVRRWRPTSRMASSRRPSPLRPAAIAMLGPAGRWAYPLVPIAMLSARLVSIPIVAHMPCSGVHRSPSQAVRHSSISANTRGPGASAHYSGFHGGRSGLGRGVSQKGLL
jgi:hypothetical protein